MNPSSNGTVPAGPAPSGGRDQIDVGAAALWASAFVVLAMILVQAGNRGGNTALARDVDDVSSMRILNADAGSGEDVIVVLNQTDETLSIYSVEAQRSLELYQSVPLGELFEKPVGRQGAPAPRR